MRMPWSRRAVSAAVVETSASYLIDAGEIRSLANPDEQLRALFGGWSADGIPARTEAALHFSASAACIRLISTLIAEAPAHVYRRDADGSRVRERAHPAETLLNAFSSPWQASTEFVREMTKTALLDGDAFARVVRVRGEPRELHQLFGVSVRRDDISGEPTYQVQRRGGGTETLNFRDVLHLRSPSGDAPAKQAARAIELGLQLERSALALFKNGGRPSGILTFSTRIEPAAATEIRNRWQDDIAGSGAGKVAVLGHGATFTPLDQKSTDSEHLENRRHQVLEVARFFGLSPTLLAELADASLNNSEALSRQTLSYAIGPWLTSWVAAITRALIDEADRADLYCEHETAGLLSADAKSTAEALKLLVAGPIATPNDARAKLNMPSLPDGDRLYPVQGASAPASVPSKEIPDA